jgi:Cu+-exporting ATPase
MLHAESVQTLPGRGISGTIAGLRIRIGSQTFLEESLLLIPPVLQDAADTNEQRGITTVFVSVNGKVCCTLGIADLVRATSKDAVSKLKCHVSDIMLLTGDRQGPATSVAQCVGITNVQHSISPTQKLDIIQSLQRKGRRVCMVGDGVNDAPALAQSDVGIAIGSGADVAKSTASVTLMRNDLHDVSTAISISSRTMTVIRQNFVFAFLYNVLGIPLAAGALLPAFGVQLTPMFAAAAMALSSLTVLTNALRLRTIR